MKTLWQGSMQLRLCHLWSIGFGLGCLPYMPGTWGSLLALPVYWVLVDLTWWGYAIAWLVMALFSMLSAQWTAQVLGQKDPSSIVCDEVMGMLLVLPFCQSVWWGYALGFAAFRLFDIAKPWPICRIDRCAHARYWGVWIVLDDLAAALFAAALVVCIQRLVIFL